MSLLFDGVVFVVGLKDLSNVSPRPHHYLVHTSRMLRYKGTNIIHLQKERGRREKRERKRERIELLTMQGCMLEVCMPWPENCILKEEVVKSFNICVSRL